MVNGHKFKKSKHKYDQPTLSVNGAGETSHPKNTLKSQLQEQRKQLPIAKGMSKFRVTYLRTVSELMWFSRSRGSYRGDWQA